MMLREFQELINARWSWQTDDDWEVPVLGLVGESGEVAEEFKKIARFQRYGYGGLKLDDLRLWTIDGRRSAIAYELGDALHYLTRLASVVGLNLEDIADLNLEKTTPNKKSLEDMSRL